MAKATPTPSPPISKDWLNKPFRETILIYGPAKIGKTYAYISIMEEEIKKDPNKQFFVINTDGSFPKTFNSYCVNEGLDPSELAHNITLYMATDIRHFEPTLRDIRKKANPGDWVFIDLASDPWDWGQMEFAQQSAEALGVPLADYIKKAAADAKMFGLLDSSKWSYVKALDNIYTFITKAPYNVVGVYMEKSTAVEEARRKPGDKPVEKTKENMLRIWSIIGAKPGGNPSASYKYDTILYLYGEGDRRAFVVMGDRGNLEVGQPVGYKNFWRAFTKYRQKKNPLYAKKPTTPPPQSPKKLENVKNPSPPPEHSNMEEENEW